MSFRVVFASNNSLIWKISYWEIPALERHINYLNHYALGSSVVIVLFDLTKKSSFEKAELILKQLESIDTSIKYLIGHKSDLLSAKKNMEPVSESEAEMLAKNYNCEYKTTSVNDPESIDLVRQALFEDLAKMIGDKMELQSLLGKNVSVGNKLFEHETFLKSLKDSEYFDN